MELGGMLAAGFPAAFSELSLSFSWGIEFWMCSLQRAQVDMFIEYTEGAGVF